MTTKTIVNKEKVYESFCACCCRAKECHEECEQMCATDQSLQALLISFLVAELFDLEEFNERAEEYGARLEEIPGTTDYYLYH